MDSRLFLRLGLLLDVEFGAALLRLASIMAVLILSLASAVAREAGDGASDGALCTVAHARCQVVQLSARLLLAT